jgi:hypothetical protein
VHTQGGGGVSDMPVMLFVMDGVVKKGIKNPRLKNPNEGFMVLAFMGISNGEK